MIETLSFLRRFLKDEIRLPELIEAPLWYFTIHLPYMCICIAQSFFVRPMYKNLYWTRRVYDAQCRNDFKKGNYAEFLYKLGCIKRFTYEEDDGRGYFIGYIDED